MSLATISHEIARASAPGTFTLTAFADCPPGRLSAQNMPESGTWTGTFWSETAKMFVAAHGTWNYTEWVGGCRHVEVHTALDSEPLTYIRRSGIANILSTCLQEVVVLSSAFDPE